MRLQLLLVAVPCIVLLFLVVNFDYKTVNTLPQPSGIIRPHSKKAHPKSQGLSRRNNNLRKSGVKRVSNSVEIDKNHNDSNSGVSRLSRINLLLKEHMKKLSEMRKKALDRNSKDTSDWNLAAQPIREGGEEYAELDFDKLTIQAPTEDVHYVFISNYYNYSSNNCTQFSITGHIRLPCTSNAASTFDVAMTAGDLAFMRQIRGFQVRPTITLTHISVIRRGFINNEGDVLSSGYRLITQRCIVKEHYTNETDFFRHSDHGAGIPYHPEIFSAHMHKGSGVYHGIIEVMQRVVPYLGFLRRHKNIKLHFQFSHPIIQLLGIDEKRLIIAKEVKADVVYMPQGSGCWGTPLFPLQLLSLHMRRNLQSPKQDTIVIIKRNKSAKDRYFALHDEIVEKLSNVADRFGLQVAVFSDTPLPPFEDQVKMFSKALVVVGPHGAGLSNTIFSQPGTLIIEGASLWGPSKTIKNHYLNMAVALGFRYYGLYSEDLRFITPRDIEKPLLDYLNARSDKLDN